MPASTPNPQAEKTLNNQICARPTCNRTAAKEAHKYYNGLCLTHAYAAGYLKPRVDVAEARKELDRLTQGGWIKEDIYRDFNIDQHIITDIRDSRRAKISQTTLDRLRAIPTLSPHQRLAWPLIRRIQSLRGIGITPKELQQDLGLTKSQIERFMWNTIKYVSVELDGKIRAYFERHKLDDPRSVSAQVEALRLPRPMQWENIDDPNEEWPRGPRSKKGDGSPRITASPLFYERLHLIVDHLDKKSDVLRLLHIHILTLNAWTSDNPPETVTRSQYNRVNYHAKRIAKLNPQASQKEAA